MTIDQAVVVSTGVLNLGAMFLFYGRLVKKFTTVVVVLQIVAEKVGVPWPDD